MLTCLRCRQCSLEPDTDMTHPSPVIFCGKKGERGPLILSGCALANPDYQWQGSSSNAVYLGGDKTRVASPVELAYLFANWHRMPHQMLAHRAQRRVMSLRTSMHMRGVKPKPRSAYQAHAILRTRQAREIKGNIFSAAQDAYILERHNKGDWPPTGGGPKDQRAAMQRLREEILADLAQMGPAWTWEAVGRRLWRLSPAFPKWARQAKIKRRKTNERGKSIAVSRRV